MKKNLSNKISIIPLIALFSFIILNICIVYNIYKENNIKDEILRFHVVANSNSVPDQITKLKVNENIQNYLQTLNLDNKSNEEILTTIQNNSNKILNIANETIKNDNKDYTSSLQVGKIMYDEKENAFISMNEGVYNSSKLILGNGEGKNIWSFICPNEKNISKLKNYETIMPGISKIYDTGNSTDITYKSKILEVLKNIK